MAAPHSRRPALYVSINAYYLQMIPFYAIRSLSILHIGLWTYDVVSDCIAVRQVLIFNHLNKSSLHKKHLIQGVYQTCDTLILKAEVRDTRPYAFHRVRRVRRKEETWLLIKLVLTWKKLTKPSITARHSSPIEEMFEAIDCKNNFWWFP